MSSATLILALEADSLECFCNQAETTVQLFVIKYDYFLFKMIIDVEISSRRGSRHRKEIQPTVHFPKNKLYVVKRA